MLKAYAKKQLELLTKKPLGLRLLSLIIQYIHSVIAILYIAVVLFSSDVYSLFLVMLANYIHKQAFDYFNGCVLSFYEDINDDISPVLSSGLCAMFCKDEAECKLHNNYELFYINSILVLAFLKAVCIVAIHSLSGYKYTISFIKQATL
jgi:hypothetical protein